MLYLEFEKCILLPTIVSKIAGQVAKSVDPDETPQTLFAQACLTKMHTVKYNIW